jgi:hypothetical protein
MKKVGYIYAIKALFDEYKRLNETKGDSEQIQSLREGIEYLCYPFRDDVEVMTSPLYGPELDIKESPKKLTTKELIASRRKKTDFENQLKKHLAYQKFVREILSHIQETEGSLLEWKMT